MRFLRKIAKKILLPVGAICAIFLLGGMAYSLLSGGETPAPEPKKATTEEVGTKEIKPTKPGPDTPASVSLYLLQESVVAGSNAGVSVKTVPTANCTIQVTYNGIASNDSGLTPKKADDFGVVGWTWTVPVTTPAGKWPVKVTCVYNGRSAVAIQDLVVTR